MASNRMDNFLGRMAIEQGLVTPPQLQEALDEQARDAGAGSAVPRPLGTILVAKGHLTPDQLVKLLEEQQARNVDITSFRREDRRLGKILIHRGAIPPALVQECLRHQASLLSEGQSGIPRLGEILIMRGYASAEAVRQALAAQKKVILACEKCGKRYNISAYDAAKRYTCPACKWTLHLPTALDDVRVDHTSTGLPPTP